MVAPWFADWHEAKSILRNEAALSEEGGLPQLKPEILKPNERRRTTLVTKLALQASQDLFAQVDVPERLQAVFASSEGDLDIVDRICRALTLPDRPVSPTHFHNSVHNAPAGYWSIGMSTRGASTSIGGWRGLFAAGLLEAAVQVVTEGCPVLLVAYDAPPPEALDVCVKVSEPFAVAMLLDSSAAGSLASLQLEMDANNTESRGYNSPIESMRLSSGPARSLPLLQAVAEGSTRRIVLPYLEEQQLAVEVRPCP